MSGLDEFDDKEEMEDMENETEKVETWKFESWILETIKHFLQIQKEVQEDLICEAENGDLYGKYGNLQ